MQCPKCLYANTKVLDSRSVDENSVIRRRRECLSCSHRFNTYERVERTPLLVVKRNGTREEFSREKLLHGIIRSAEKRPVSRQQMEQLVAEVENTLSSMSESEISSWQIGEYVMPKLMELDEVAYIRFASVYRQFQSRDMFMKELENMIKKEEQHD